MKLELYHFEECPYCAKVRGYIEKNGLRPKVAYRDIDLDPQAYDVLIKMTQDDQVPCLVIDGKPMLESEEIITWLKANVKA